MVDQCAAAFNDNGSTIQLHRFLKVRVRYIETEVSTWSEERGGMGGCKQNEKATVFFAVRGRSLSRVPSIFFGVCRDRLQCACERLELE